MQNRNRISGFFYARVAIALLLGLPLLGWSQGFVHPGLLNTRQELDFIKQQVAAGKQPWKDGFAKLQASKYASLSYVAKPIATVECGPYSQPDIGCTDETNDAAAAYSLSLMWYMTGDKAYAEKSIAIMNGWAAVLKAHTNSNSPLQAAWTAELFPRAAEIIRHTYTGWPQADIDRFSAMLNDQYLPLIKNGSVFAGNWELSMINAMAAIGVFTDNRALFDKAIAMWRRRVPSYFYLTTDGPYPVVPPNETKTNSQMVSYWYNQSTFVDGLAQETCRDFGHTQFGIASSFDVAEIAYHQGIPLYEEQKKRLMAALEFHAGYLSGNPAPSWLCGGKLTLGTSPTWEIAYNHYHNRDSLGLPVTLNLITKSVRPSGSNGRMMEWETLTHGGLGSPSGSPILSRPHSASAERGRLRVVFKERGQIQLVIRKPDGAPEAFYDLRGASIPKAVLP